jgi:tetratricopeptide (TPR) repeat protein
MMPGGPQTSAAEYPWPARRSRSILAEDEARNPEKALALLQQAVRAGEQALGPDAFREWEGRFWGVVETRPYMRARSALAESLWLWGERRQSVAHLEALLRLNPGDNQGLRYILSIWYIQIGNDAALGRLLHRYAEDTSPPWLYTTALGRFRRNGDKQEARRALDQALEASPNVPAYLLGRKTPPKYTPELDTMGEESEAIVYAVDCLPAWRASDGALSWLARRVPQA